MAYSERFDEALTFAAELHRDQIRKGSDVPYVTHLLGVASLVGANGGDEDQVIAALLHDAIEDCVGDVPDIADRIEQRFGERVHAIVDGLTDAYQQPKPPWSERKEAYLEHVQELPGDSPVLLVCLADKLHNVRSIVRDLREQGDAIWEIFNGGQRGTLWYYATLAEIFAEKMDGYLVEEFRRSVEAMVDEGGLPDETRPDETETERLVRMLEGRLDGRFSVHDALQVVIVESADRAELLAEVDPGELSCEVSLRVRRAEDERQGGSFGDVPDDERQAFAETAGERLAAQLGDWFHHDFELREPARLTSGWHAGLPDDAMVYRQPLVRAVSDIDDLVEVLRWVDQTGTVLSV